MAKEGLKICITKHLHLRGRSCHSAQPCIKPSAQPCIKMHAAGLGNCLLQGWWLANMAYRRLTHVNCPTLKERSHQPSSKSLLQGWAGVLQGWWRSLCVLARPTGGSGLRGAYYHTLLNHPHFRVSFMKRPDDLRRNNDIDLFAGLFPMVAQLCLVLADLDHV